jgi:hypothetical protein
MHCPHLVSAQSVERREATLFTKAGTETLL